MKSNYRRGADRSTTLDNKRGFKGGSHGAAGPCVSLVTGRVVTPSDTMAGYKEASGPKLLKTKRVNWVSEGMVQSTLSQLFAYDPICAGERGIIAVHIREALKSTYQQYSTLAAWRKRALVKFENTQLNPKGLT